MAFLGKLGSALGALGAGATGGAVAAEKELFRRQQLAEQNAFRQLQLEAALQRAENAADDPDKPIIDTAKGLLTELVKARHVNVELQGTFEKYPVLAQRYEEGIQHLQDIITRKIPASQFDAARFGMLRRVAGGVTLDPNEQTSPEGPPSPFAGVTAVPGALGGPAAQAQLPGEVRTFTGPVVPGLAPSGTAVAAAPPGSTPLARFGAGYASGDEGPGDFPFETPTIQHQREQRQIQEREQKRKERETEARIPGLAAQAKLTGSRATVAAAEAARAEDLVNSTIEQRRAAAAAANAQAGLAPLRAEQIIANIKKQADDSHRGWAQLSETQRANRAGEALRKMGIEVQRAAVQDQRAYRTAQRARLEYALKNADALRLERRERAIFQAAVSMLGAKISAPGGGSYPGGLGGPDEVLNTAFNLADQVTRRLQAGAAPSGGGATGTTAPKAGAVTQQQLDLVSNALKNPTEFKKEVERARKNEPELYSIYTRAYQQLKGRPYR